MRTFLDDFNNFDDFYNVDDFDEVDDFDDFQKNHHWWLWFLKDY